ncbi:hypothetical protein ACA910_011467 [Epithemia clementina (nom. ined.)]
MEGWATQFDVTECFQALEDVNGTISIPDLRTIYLGLGFLPTRFATITNLTNELNLVRKEQYQEQQQHHHQHREESVASSRAASSHNHTAKQQLTPQLVIADSNGRVTLEQTLHLLSRHHRKNRQEELRAVFGQCWDVNNVGYIDADQVRTVANRQLTGGEQEWTLAQAERLLRYTSIVATGKTKTTAEATIFQEAGRSADPQQKPTQLSFAEFERIFAVPPPPTANNQVKNIK